MLDNESDIVIRFEYSPEPLKSWKDFTKRQNHAHACPFDKTDMIRNCATTEYYYYTLKMKYSQELAYLKGQEHHA